MPVVTTQAEVNALLELRDQVIGARWPDQARNGGVPACLPDEVVYVIAHRVQIDAAIGDHLLRRLSKHLATSVVHCRRSVNTRSARPRCSAVISRRHLRLSSHAPLEKVRATPASAVTAGNN